MEFTLKFDTAAITQAIDALGARAAPAIARSLNRAAVSTRTLMARKVAADVGLKAGDVTKQIQIVNASASANRLSAFVVITGAKIPLLAFNAKASKRGGVIARLPPPGKGRYPFAFIATMPNKKVGVFARTRYTKGAPVYGRRGNPKLERIEQLHGPSLPNVFAKYIPEALARGEESMQKNLAHELSFAQSQAG